jgi:methionyl-tRNA formyltransferase
MSNQYRVLFMGSPDFCIPTLDQLINHPKVTLLGVVSQPDKPKGRGKQHLPTPVKTWALDHELNTYCPLSKNNVSQIVNKLNPTLIVVVAYGMILPPSVTDNYVCINGHASLLPQYRGASPIQSSLLNNDTKTGITLIKITDKMDAGDIVLTVKTPINDEDTLKTLHDQLSLVCATAFETYLNNPQSGIPQNENEATYCSKLTTANRELLPTDPIDVKWGKIRAFSPKPGAFIIIDGHPTKIINAKQEGNELTPVIVQPPGKKPMNYDDYLRGGYPECVL